MRKLFFVKKNVNEPTGASNWIEMNVDEFNEFIKFINIHFYPITCPCGFVYILLYKKQFSHCCNLL